MQYEELRRKRCQDISNQYLHPKKAVLARETEDLYLFYDPEVPHTNHSGNTKLLLWMSSEDVHFPILCDTKC